MSKLRFSSVFALTTLLTMWSVAAIAQNKPTPGTVDDPLVNQTTAGGSSDAGSTVDSSDVGGKRLFGIIPNYRTSASLADYKPITAREKYRVATQDAFDRGTVMLAAAFAGEGELANASPSFGQGWAGYGRYFGTSYADYVIGDYMTEAIFPSFLHQDPRFFRSGKGTGWSRLRYSAGQIFWTHNDNGSQGFNYSEVVGNSAAVAISNSYYPDNRDASSAVQKLGTQLAVDMASNILKEFGPDLYRKLSRKH